MPGSYRVKLKGHDYREREYEKVGTDLDNDRQRQLSSYNEAIRFDIQVHLLIVE